MLKTRIAVVSTNHLDVNAHFGKARRFLIYDIDDRMTFVEERRAEMLSEDNPDHAFDPAKMTRIASCLKDCSKVYVSKIGERPAAHLKGQGTEPVIFSGPIKDIA